jgi:ATP-binding cassette, subfamily B, bacterial
VTAFATQAGLLRPLWRALPPIVVLAVFAAIGRITVPFAVQRVIDEIASGAVATAGRPDLSDVIGIAAAVIAGACICSAAMLFLISRAVETVLVDVRIRLLSHLHRLTELDRRALKRGALLARLTSDVDQITDFLQRGGAYMAINAAHLLLTAGLMLHYSWPLALVTFVILAPLARVLPRAGQRLAACYKEIQERSSAMLALSEETIAGASVIRVYGVEGRFGARLKAVVAAQHLAQLRAQRASAYAFVIGESVVAVITAAVVIFGMVLGAGGRLTLGELSAFVFLMALFVRPLQGVAENLNNLQNALIAIRRIRELLRWAPSVIDPEEPASAIPEGPLGLSVERVTFAYPGSRRPALDDVSLTIAPGRMVAVVGETGSGKTTLLAMLSRTADPGCGRVRLGGVDLRRLRAPDLRTSMHLVPQDGFLLGRTIAENVRPPGSVLDDRGVTSVFVRLGLGDWLSSLPDGVSTEVGEGGRSLSAGERQLVALARAYAADPRVLLLDEATAQLDALTESRMVAAVDSVTRGRTAIAIAHRLSTAERADEVVVMSAGRIVQRGPHSELVSQPGPYAQLYAAWRERTNPNAGKGRNSVGRARCLE